MSDYIYIEDVPTITIGKSYPTHLLTVMVHDIYYSSTGNDLAKNGTTTQRGFLYIK